MYFSEHCIGYFMGPYYLFTQWQLVGKLLRAGLKFKNLVDLYLYFPTPTFYRIHFDANTDDLFPSAIECNKKLGLIN